MLPFKLPSLPKSVYLELKALTTITGLSQWQIVIAGIQVMTKLGTQQPAYFLATLDAVKKEFPAPAAPVAAPAKPYYAP